MQTPGSLHGGAGTYPRAGRCRGLRLGEPLPRVAEHVALANGARRQSGSGEGMGSPPALRPGASRSTTEAGWQRRQPPGPAGPARPGSGRAPPRPAKPGGKPGSRGPHWPRPGGSGVGADAAPLPGHRTAGGGWGLPLAAGLAPRPLSAPLGHAVAGCGGPGLSAAMEQLLGGWRPRLVSSLGLGQRSCEVTLDEERGFLTWRDPRHPHRGGGEWSGGAGRAGLWRQGGR